MKETNVCLHYKIYLICNQYMPSTHHLCLFTLSIDEVNARSNVSNLQLHAYANYFSLKYLYCKIHLLQEVELKFTLVCYKGLNRVEHG